MSRSFGLFERFGVELEYMLVDAASLDVRPEADRLIQQVSGSLDGDVPRDRLEWSNELALHVIELKTRRPVPRLPGLAELFQKEIRYLNRRLQKTGARLLPGAMHPWMNPQRESRLWPHGCSEIYAAFHRIFNCRGHGWTNLQSTHVNFPFATESEFDRLHTAIRLLLPLLPALAASSPYVEGHAAPWLDMRLEVYRQNCRRIPSVTGRIVPEPVRSPAEYQQRILNRIYRDLAPLDPEGTLRDEWVNARGAIARFCRNTIEIRVLDIQECPQADLAIVGLIESVLRHLTQQTLSSTETQRRPRTADLERLLLATARDPRSTLVRAPTVLQAFGLTTRRPVPVIELWRHLIEQSAPLRAWWRPPVEILLSAGTLSERLRHVLGATPSRTQLRTVYRELADCLLRGTLFLP